MILVTNVLHIPALLSQSNILKKIYKNQELMQPRDTFSSSSSSLLLLSVFISFNKLCLSSDLLLRLNTFFNFELRLSTLSREVFRLLHSQSSIPLTAGSSGSNPLSGFYKSCVGKKMIRIVNNT